MTEDQSYHLLPSSHGDCTDDVKRTLSGSPPAHYTLEIDSFSDLQIMLKETGLNSYESQTFEAGGYKWKLSLYPNGDEERNGKGHISMYLVIVETDALPLGWEVYANFKLFVFDHIRDKFLKIQDAMKRVRRFNRMKTEWGFAQLIPQNAFHDPSNGYLTLDKCAFGTEVSVSRLGKGERLRPMEIVNSCYTWKINRFSRLQENFYYSETFTVADVKWKLLLYPKGNAVAGKHLSLFLCLQESKAPTRVFANFKLSILDEHDTEVRSCRGQHWFTAAAIDWGWSKYASLTDISDSSKGFVVNDTLIIKARIISLSTLKCFS